MTVNIAVIYHSGFGHTHVIATHVVRGCESIPSTHTHMIRINEEGEISEKEWETLHNADTIIFGSPTYMGSMSGPMKMFVDQTSKPWFSQKWKDKIAGGFTNSSGLSGDKLNTLFQFCILASQHGMIWVGNAFLSTGRTDTDTNRLCSYVGLMTQADNVSAELSPPDADHQSAVQFGARLAQVTHRWKLSTP